MIFQVVRTNYETSVGRPLQNLPEEMEEGVTDKGSLMLCNLLCNNSNINNSGKTMVYI